MQYSSILGSFNVKTLLIIELVLMFQSWVFGYFGLGLFGLGYFGVEPLGMHPWCLFVVYDSVLKPWSLKLATFDWKLTMGNCFNGTRFHAKMTVLQVGRIKISCHYRLESVQPQEKWISNNGMKIYNSRGIENFAIPIPNSYIGDQQISSTSGRPRYRFMSRKIRDIEVFQQLI